jgi:hypothetical protein
VDAWGCDFSEAILRRSLRPVRPYLRREDVEDLGGHPDREFDLVSCMEVLEHLPERHVEETVAELRRIARGTVFITVPSFGPDVTGGYGLPMHDTWLEDARADRRFRRIVVGEDGRPHHGHLTLASHRWWTDLFLRHGLSRNNDIEAAMLRDRRRSLARWRLNPYVLHEVRGASWVAGESCVRQGVAGWHDLEQDPEGRAFRWTTERSTAVLLGGPAHQRLRLTVAGAPPSLVHDQAVELAVAPALGGGDAVRRTLEVPLGRWSEILVDGLSVAGGPVHVTLDVVRTFRPSRLPGGSADTRELGVMVSRMSLE